jgi:hypothetical protein
VEIGCEQPLKPGSISAALQAQRLALGSNGLGDLPVSSSLFDALAHRTMLPANPVPRLLVTAAAQYGRRCVMKTHLRAAPERGRPTWLHGASTAGFCEYSQANREAC